MWTGLKYTLVGIHAAEESLNLNKLKIRGQAAIEKLNKCKQEV